VKEGDRKVKRPQILTRVYTCTKKILEKDRNTSSIHMYVYEYIYIHMYIYIHT
jgi:hypothetical protein